MASRRLEEAFPGLRNTRYSVRSPRSPRYNCVAWAAGDSSRWWWPVHPPQAPYYWPSGIPNQITLESFILAFESLGYAVCEGSELERGFEKVALYASSYNVPTHAARQLESGVWTSKLGERVDIEHATVSALQGSRYGAVARILRRPRPRGTGLPHR
jgi:hypothetical protein